MTPALDLTVVIPAHNSAGTLGEQLDALLAQDWQGTWEIVVVDNRSTDATAECVRGYAERDARVHLVDAPDRPSIGYARNVGIDNARGAAIVMVDADDVVTPGWLRAIGEALREHDFVTGPIDVHQLNPSWVVDTRGSRIEHGAGEFLGVFPFSHSCNLGFRRDALDRVGRFDPTLVNGSDVELSHRFWKAGIPLTYVDDAVVCYRYRDTMKGLYRQARNYARVKAPLTARFRAAGTPVTLPSDARYLLWLVRRLPITRTRSGRARWVWVLGTTVGGLQGRRRSRTTPTSFPAEVGARSASDRPTCSVVVPAYNTGAYVPETIASILAQTYRPHEVIVVDDGSTDDTPVELAAFGDSIVAIRQPNSGPGRARNAGAAAATGELIAFLDSDDIWEPERLAACVDRLMKRPDVSIVTTDAYIIEGDERTARTYYGSGARRDQPFPAPDRQLAEILRQNFVFSSAVLWRSDFEAVGGFDEDRALMGSEDYDLWLRLIANGGIVDIVDAQLAGYRVRPGNFTSDVSRQWATHLAVLERNLPSLWHRGIRAQSRLYFEIAQRCAQAGRRREAGRFIAMGARTHDLPLGRRVRAVAAGVRGMIRGNRSSRGA